MDTTYHAATALAYGTTPGREQDERFQTSRNAERLVQARLLHEIFGNSFRLVTLDDSWLTPTVRNLAQASYDDRILPSGELQIDRRAVLADALEDAGCTEATILEHLRGPGPHIRGCHVLDMLLQRSGLEGV